MTTISSHLELHLTCPLCGHLMQFVTEGRPIAGREINAVVRCSTCTPTNAEWLVMVRMVPVNTQMLAGRANPVRVASCGTESGYTRHVRAGEPTCDACKAAHSAAESGRQAARRRSRRGVLV